MSSQKDLELQQVKFVQTDQVKLSPAQLHVDSILFLETATVDLAFPMEGVAIKYAFNDHGYKRFEGPLSISQTSRVSYFANKPGFINSDTSRVELIKSKTPSTKIQLSVNPLPSESYPGGGINSFLDLQKGGLNFRAGQFWSGFQSEVVEFNLKFESNISLTDIKLSCLSDHGSWIFLPQRIEIYNHSDLIGEKILIDPEKALPSSMEFIQVQVESAFYDEIKLKVYPLNGIPEWHPGKGTVPWLFIDEIIVN